MPAGIRPHIKYSTSWKIIYPMQFLSCHIIVPANKRDHTNRKCKRPLICEKEVKQVCPSLHAVAKIAKNWGNRSFC